MASSEHPVTIKAYASQRLYNPGTARYVTLDDLAAMVDEDQDFIVRQAETGDDITRSILKQIIFRRRHD